MDTKPMPLGANDFWDDHPTGPAMTSRAQWQGAGIQTSFLPPRNPDPY